uniref:PIH1 domain-containing protein 2 n=1 Tax=Doryrhamphus excisus TaxID=161450 RepID=UPI0025AE9C69|nr:PIH1 domain-containing protein 2 [Doryrhamphus excisus]
MSSDRDVVVQRANQLWSMLNGLCQWDPEAYRSFVEKQMKSGMEYYEPPRMESCICTDILDPQGPLYINICSWKRVPALQDSSKPLPVYAGSLEADTKEGGPSVVDIAFNPEVLKKCRKNKAEMTQVYMLAQSFAQQRYGIQLASWYTIVSSSPRNSPEDLHRRLGFQQQQVNPDKQSDAAGQSPDSLLQKITSLRLDKENIVGRPVVRKKGLIEVISSTTFKQPEKPEHRLEVKAGAQGFPRKLELTVELPKISSMSEWQLKMSKEDVLLEVEDIYLLLLDFPNAVNENSTVAIFNKKNRRLTVTADIL